MYVDFMFFLPIPPIPVSTHTLQLKIMRIQYASLSYNSKKSQIQGIVTHHKYNYFWFILADKYICIQDSNLLLRIIWQTLKQQALI